MFPLFSFNETFIKRTPKKYLKWTFLLLPTWNLITSVCLIQPNIPDTRNAKDCVELPPTNFSIFTLKNVTWRTYLISFTVQDCFLLHFVCIELVSLIWFLQIWVAIRLCLWYYYCVTLIKKIMQTSIFMVSGSIIWPLIWRYISKPVLGRHPVLSGHNSIPRGCPLNTGFTVHQWHQVTLFLWIFFFVNLYFVLYSSINLLHPYSYSCIWLYFLELF